MRLNINVGILGHVDAGKTSLAKLLSQIGSTASFDKNPQSRQRGITLDLGFSALSCPAPEHLQDRYKKVQFTLVDCPGHASLIKTIMGGAHIIDFMLLVVDVTKGFQTQTSECLIIGEITCKKMIVVLNKTDLLPQKTKRESINKMRRKVLATIAPTEFKGSPVVAVSTVGQEGLQDLLQCMIDFITVPQRNVEDPFLCAVDHCFAIVGKGTILTGTILQGNIKINDSIEIPALKTQRKIKTMQMFKKPSEKACAGDRIGICVPHFDPKLFERGIICSPGYIKEVQGVVAEVYKIKYYKQDVATKSKFHITLGHTTVVAVVTFFASTTTNQGFSYDDQYEYSFNLTDDVGSKKQYVLLEFATPVLTQVGSTFIAAKLDTDIHTSACRLAFWGTIKQTFKDLDKTTLSKLKIYKDRFKTGIVERAPNKYEVIARNMFNKETDLQVFIGLKITLSTGEHGFIESTFGQSGKVKLRIPDGLGEKTFEMLKEKKNNSSGIKQEAVEVFLSFKKYIYDTTKKIIQ